MKKNKEPWLVAWEVWCDSNPSFARLRYGAAGCQSFFKSGYLAAQAEVQKLEQDISLGGEVVNA